MQPRKRILFVCTGNACRSQMAEAILRHVAGDRFIALSAGSRPAGFVHPLALQTLDEMNIPTEGLESKSLKAFIGQPVDICVTVCDNASAECPTWSPATVQAHWPLPDPTYFDGTNEERLAFCRSVAQRLLDKINKLTSLPVEAMPRDRLSERLEQLACL